MSFKLYISNIAQWTPIKDTNITTNAGMQTQPSGCRAIARTTMLPKRPERFQDTHRIILICNIYPCMWKGLVTFSLLSNGWGGILWLLHWPLLLPSNPQHMSCFSCVGYADLPAVYCHRKCFYWCSKLHGGFIIFLFSFKEFVKTLPECSFYMSIFVSQLSIRDVWTYPAQSTNIDICFWNSKPYYPYRVADTEKIVDLVVVLFKRKHLYIARLWHNVWRQCFCYNETHQLSWMWK